MRLSIWVEICSRSMSDSLKIIDNHEGNEEEEAVQRFRNQAGRRAASPSVTSRCMAGRTAHISEEPAVPMAAELDEFSSPASLNGLSQLAVPASAALEFQRQAAGFPVGIKDTIE